MSDKEYLKPLQSPAHPGMFGIFPPVDAARQIRGKCGERHVKHARLALITGTVILGAD